MPEIIRRPIIQLKMRIVGRHTTMSPCSRGTTCDSKGSGVNARRILLAGATGYIGRVVATRLIERGFDVTALVRTPDPALTHCRQIATDVIDASRLAADLDGQHFDFVISCLASRTGAPDDAWRVDHDANQNLLSLCPKHSVQQFVLLSAICVQKPKLAFQHAKLAFEQALERSGVPFSIVRPTAFFKSLSGQLQRVQAGKPFLLFGDGTLTACKPIAERDLADYLIDCVESPERLNQVLPIGGPGPALTARDQGMLLFEQAGKPPRFRSVSPKLLSGIAALLTPLGKLIPAIAAKAEFARIGHYYATESMLLWNETQQHYDAEATPVSGTRTLREHYAQLISEGIAGHEAREHKMF